MAAFEADSIKSLAKELAFLGFTEESFVEKMHHSEVAGSLNSSFIIELHNEIRTAIRDKKNKNEAFRETQKYITNLLKKKMENKYTRLRKILHCEYDGAKVNEILCWAEKTIPNELELATNPKTCPINSAATILRCWRNQNSKIKK